MAVRYNSPDAATEYSKRPGENTRFVYSNPTVLRIAVDIDPSLIIEDYARELSELLDQAGGEQDDVFERGRKFGLAQAASLLVQEARAFGADANKLGLGVLSDRNDLL